MLEFGRKIAIGNDHAGYEMKEFLKGSFEPEGYTFYDEGTYSESSVDYPDFAFPVCQRVLDGDVSTGVLICGTGNGMAMTANKKKGIRAALCWNPEIARLARLHNDANVLVLPGRFLTQKEAEAIFKVFMITMFEGGRHIPRIEKMNQG